MPSYNLYTTRGTFVRTITGDSFRRAVETDVKAGNSYADINVHPAIAEDPGWIGTNLSGLDFRGANFTRANLQGCDLTETLCQKADFTSADLTNTKMVRTKLNLATQTNTVTTNQTKRECEGG